MHKLRTRHIALMNIHLIEMRRHRVSASPKIEIMRKVKFGVVGHLGSNVEFVDHVAAQGVFVLVLLRDLFSLSVELCATRGHACR